MWRYDRRMDEGGQHRYDQHLTKLPSGLNLTSSPKRVCDITTTGCVSNDFDIRGVQYSHICGRVIGYQKNIICMLSAIIHVVLMQIMLTV